MRSTIQSGQFDRRNPQAGIGLIEASIAITLLAVTIMATFSLLDSSRRFASSSLEAAAVADLAQDLVYDVERELTGAAFYIPAAPLVLDLAANDTSAASLASTAGFPPMGEIVIDRGGALEEVVSYTSLHADGTQLLGLSRAQACTQGAAHLAGPGDVLWRGLAELIDDQGTPPASAYDGSAQGEEGLEYFRGQGTGLVYRIPIDTTGSGSVLDENTLQWGAVLNEFGPTTDGYVAIYYSPRDTYDENIHGFDVNRDGDTEDVFDIGQLRRVTWDASDPTHMEDIGIGPSAILQEQCAWGSDLNGDQAEDPMFLVNETRRTLHMRFYLIGRSNPQLPIIQHVESVVYLRNDPDA